MNFTLNCKRRISIRLFIIRKSNDILSLNENHAEILKNKIQQLCVNRITQLGYCGTGKNIGLSIRNSENEKLIDIGINNTSLMMIVRGMSGG